MHLGDDANIIITPWRRAVVKPSTLSLRASSGWVTVDNIKDDGDDHSKTNVAEGEQSKPPDASLPADPSPEVPATVLDSGTTQDDTLMNGDSQVNQGQKRTTDSPLKENGKPRHKQPKLDAPAATSSSSKKPGLTTTGPDGVQAWDLGGNGDCGFRCIGAIQAVRNKAGLEQVEAKLRAKAVAWLRENQGWLDAWAIDRDARVRSEGGNIPSNVPKYLDPAARPSKWLDHYLALACARVINSEVMVWKFVGGKWVFLEHLAPPSTRS